MAEEVWIWSGSREVWTQVGLLLERERAREAGGELLWAIKSNINTTWQPVKARYKIYMLL